LKDFKKLLVLTVYLAKFFLKLPAAFGNRLKWVLAAFINCFVAALAAFSKSAFSLGQF
jgi:hypothetical protein